MMYGWVMMAPKTSSQSFGTTSGLFDPSHIQVQESPFGLVETVSGRHEVGVW
ncbi:hypothetical protein F9C07_6039 [Aspergillus flavus]|uniref:Uncharacterized protein n=1 Tax=Aspergillus flavus (strain ATCC 200026 / FGSC A1120 / IAM 13836 / NRRL 3357 / JCM 12722 / SRRC 167) TaxID=332952 RepID=A0A7U2MY40_ASPFN|nr:hypothetical protein F9C07_6039 [Aspergillus flavus]